MNKFVISCPWPYIKAAAYGASNDGTRPSICGVRIEVSQKQAVFAGTNGKILISVRYRCFNEEGGPSFTIPISLINKVDCDPSDVVSIFYDGDSQRISIEDQDERGAGYSETFRFQEYPNWRQVYPSGKPIIGFQGMFNPELLLKIQEAANLLTKTTVVLYKTGGLRDPILAQGVDSDFIGILMPMKAADEELTFNKPDWI